LTPGDQTELEHRPLVGAMDAVVGLLSLSGCLTNSTNSNRVSPCQIGREHIWKILYSDKDIKVVVLFKQRPARGIPWRGNQSCVAPRGQKSLLMN
jgi:hypothetical protein